MKRIWKRRKRGFIEKKTCTFQILPLPLQKKTKKNTLKVTRKPTLTGKTNTLELNITQEQLALYEAGGIFLQNAFPQLSPPEREFIKSGITPQEWKEFFG